MPVALTLPRGYITQARPIAAPLSLTRLTPCRPPACRLPVRCSAHPNSRQDAGEVVQENTDPPLKPLRGPFVRAPLISYEKRTRACRLCAGSGTVMCEGCAGRGRLPAGGYQKRNPVTAARVVGSKWTALQRTFGWRHFQCSQKRKEGKETFVMLTATCDGTVQLWINIKNLKDRTRWASGWLQKQEIRAMEDAGVSTGAECRTCGSSGQVACPRCSLAGQIVEL